ncbi:MAG: type VI secretion system tube protein Hcp [Agarilytica sp.]
MIFIEYEGIEGNATAKGYEKHIRVDSLQFGVGRGITMEPGNLANREATRPSLSEVTFTHKTDNSATALFKESVSGSQGKKVTIKFVQTGADKLVEYMTYTLTDVLVSGYSISADGDNDPLESISLSYAKIEVRYHDYDKTNKGASPQTVFYDLETGTPG